MASCTFLHGEDVYQHTKADSTHILYIQALAEVGQG